MVGNVEEWTGTMYNQAVMSMGGGWSYGPVPTGEYRLRTQSGDISLGFRCARDVDGND